VVVENYRKLPFAYIIRPYVPFCLHCSSLCVILLMESGLSFRKDLNERETYYSPNEEDHS